MSALLSDDARTVIAELGLELATVAQLVERARRGGLQAQQVAGAAYLLALPGVAVYALCCGCLEAHDRARAAPSWCARLLAGGECDRCPYVGPDCLVVATLDGAAA